MLGWSSEKETKNYKDYFYYRHIVHTLLYMSTYAPINYRLHILNLHKLEDTTCHYFQTVFISFTNEVLQTRKSINYPYN